MMEGPGADSEEKHEPVSDIDTAVVVVGLKALDPEWPIREAIDTLLPSSISPGADIRERSCSRLLARSSLFLRLSRGASPGSADGSHLPAASASAKEPIATIGLEPRHTHSRRHLELLQDLSRSRIDPPHVALVAFPSAVPELAVDPGDPGNDAVGFDGAKNGSCFGIDLMDLPISVLPCPERPFRPRKPGVTAAARRRDRREHTAGLRIDLLDAILGDLKQVLTVERSSCMRGDIDRPHRLSTLRIGGAQLVSRRKPHMLTVKRHTMHVAGARKRAILAKDFGC
jgi:hypothetical protein